MPVAAPPSAGLPAADRQVRLVATLTLAMATSTFMGFAFGALAPFVAADLDLSRTAVGGLISLVYAVGALGSPTAGRLVDRYGGGRVILALFALWIVVALAVAAPVGLPALLVAAAVAGVPVALGNPASNQLTAAHVGASRQGVVTGVKQSGVQLGAFAAGVLLPPLAAAAGWRAAIAATALLGVAGLALGWPVLRARSGHGGGGSGTGSPLRVGALTAYAGAMGLGVGAVTAHLPLYVVLDLGGTEVTGGRVAALAGLAGVAARIAWGRAADRTVHRTSATLRWLAAGAVLATAGYAAADVIGAWVLWPAATLFGVTAVAWNAVGMLALVRDVDVRQSGRAAGRVLLAFNGGLLVGPLAYGAAVDLTGRTSVGWGVLGAGFAIAALVAGRTDLT